MYSLMPSKWQSSVRLPTRRSFAVMLHLTFMVRTPDDPSGDQILTTLTSTCEKRMDAAVLSHLCVRLYSPMPLATTCPRSCHSPVLSTRPTSSL